MKKNTKIALIVVGATLVVGGVGAYLYYRNKNNGKNGENENGEPELPETSTDSYTQPSNSSSGAVSGGCQYPQTPFKNKTEGDKFRKWVNTTFPDYAKQIDLDPSGSYNNCYIRQAYDEKRSKYIAYLRKGGNGRA